MIGARAIDTSRAEEESVHFAFRSGYEDESVPGAIGWVGCIDLADMVRVAVVERVFLRYVTAELAVIGVFFGRKSGTPLYHV